MPEKWARQNTLIISKLNKKSHSVETERLQRLLAI